MSVFHASISLQHSGHLLSLPVFHLPFSHMTSPYTAHQFLLKTFLHSNLHSYLIHFSYQQLLLPRCFLQTWIFSCCFSVSAIVSSAFMLTEATHELCIFPLLLRDMRLSPIIPSNFLSAFAPVVIPTVTKTIKPVDFALGKCHIINCNTQRYMFCSIG